MSRNSSVPTATVNTMGHYAQYRHRGGGNTGFLTGPPATTSFVLSNGAGHATCNPTNPGISGVVDAFVITYNTATPQTIVDTFAAPFGSNTSGGNVFVGGTTVGMRIAYRNAAGTIISPYSAEKSLLF